MDCGGGGRARNIHWERRRSGHKAATMATRNRRSRRGPEREIEQVGGWVVERWRWRQALGKCGGGRGQGPDRQLPQLM